ncbi:unnamed protein product, partial [marine sediment metagenome]
MTKKRQSPSRTRLDQRPLTLSWAMLAAVLFCVFWASYL